MKPSGFEVAKIRVGMRPRVFDAGGFCDMISAGYAWTPGILQGGHDETCWKRQQVIGLDFDNSVVLLDEDGRPLRDDAGKILKRNLVSGDEGYLSCKGALMRLYGQGILPMCAYESYSSTAASRRFRIVLCLDEVVNDPRMLLDAVDRLIYLFPEADRSCSDLARLFFGTGCGKECLNFAEMLDDYRPVSLDSILALPKRPSTVNKARSYRVGIHKAVDSTHLSSVKASADLIEMIRKDTGEAGRRIGKVVRFHNCPICGHHDCFAFYPETNSWSCFSESNMTGHVGGSAIDYIMARSGVTYRAALAQLTGKK